MHNSAMIKLSPYNQAFYNVWKINPQRSDYNIVFDQDLFGKINVENLEDAIKRLMADYVVLHSRVVEENGACFWIEDANISADLDYFDQPLSAPELLEYVKKPFNLESGPLLRCALIKVAQEHFRLILIIHHIVMDGAKVDFFVDTLSSYYNDKNFHVDVTLETQRKYLQELSATLEKIIKDNEEAYQAFWKEGISNAANVDLLFLKPNSIRADLIDDVKEFRFAFDPEICKKIQIFKKKYGITTYLFGQLVFAILLYRHTGQEMVGISYPVTINEGMNFLYGAHINTCIVPYQMNAQTQISDLINATKKYFKDVKAGLHQYYPIEKIVSTMHNQNVLEVGFIQTNLRDKKFTFSKTKDTKINSHVNIDLPAKLLFEQEVQGDVIHYRVRYNLNYIDSGLLKNFIEAYKKLFVEVLNDLLVQKNDILVEKYPIVDEQQRQLLLKKWNDTKKKYSQKQTIHELFEAQVENSPNKTAVIYENKKLTYAELNTLANQLAHYLKIQYKIKPDALIALCLERNEYMLVCILAVLKVGAAYLPIDPSYPATRIDYIIENSGAKIILTNTKFAKELKNIFFNRGLNIVVFDKYLLKKIKNQPVTNLTNKSNSKSLAYVIYTSGTTGKPKGVMVEHQGVVNRIEWMNNAYPLTDEDKILQKTPYVFDVSVWELFWANWYGATIVFAKPEGHKDPDYLIELINKQGVTIVHFTPSMLAAFEEAMAEYGKSEVLPSLRYLFCSGEALNISEVNKAYELLPKVKICNLYGPTEASIDVLYYNCTANGNIKSVPIGKPIDNTSIYILNQNGELLPIGALGELHIGGVGLARGYLHQPQLTEEKFIANPFQTESEKKRNENARLYKTGDLVRWLPDGNIEYIGRNDFQVKIRGYRIELGEIENILNTYPGILKSFVIAMERQDAENKKNADKYLVGYYLTDKKVSESSILAYLKKNLPEYMVPSALVRLKNLPISINGKLDIKALPKPVFTSKIHKYIKPNNEVEITVQAIFSEVLDLSPGQISVNDDFFNLGGDSILAIRLIGKINKIFYEKLAVKDVFDLRTVRALSAKLKDKVIDKASVPETHYVPFSLVDVNQYKEHVNIDTIEDIYPASYLQLGMLLESSLTNNGTYHDVFFYTINGIFKRKKFLKVWNKLINKHPLLRAKFIFDDKHGWRIAIVKKLVVKCTVYDDQNLDQLIEEERLNNFDYNRPGLFNLIINDREEDFDFIFSFHHSIADGWSVASLINEFIQEYLYGKSIITNKDTQLSYGEFVKTEQFFLKDSNKIQFWQDYLAGCELKQIKWKNNSNKKSKNGLCVARFSLTAKESNLLQATAKANAVSIDSLFLYAYLKTISIFLNSNDVTVGVVLNNRLEKAGGDETFGLFLNAIPYRFNFANINTISAGLAEVFSLKLKLYNYKNIPYSYIRSTMKQEAYNFAFNFVHFHILNESMDAIKKWGGYERTTVPFMLNVYQKEKSKFTLELKVHDNYIDQDYLNYFLKYLKNALLDLITKQEGVKLDTQDYQKLIQTWNSNVNTYYPQNKSIAELFEEQVIKTPNASALIYKDKKISYIELNERANQLAHYLKKHCHIKPDDLIVLCLDRNEYMLVVLLAVLKAGGAYVPIDPNYPDSRIGYILDDSKAKAILTNQIYVERLKHIVTQHKPNILSIDNESFLVDLGQEKKNNLAKDIKNNNLAYVIYTSGTTGKPKGVMVEHKNLVSLISNFTLYPLSKNNALNMLSTTNYVFDIFGSEFLLPLLNGYYLELVDLLNPSSRINLNHYNCIQITPSKLELLSEWIDYGIKSSKKHVVTIIIGGEALNQITLNRIYDLEQQLSENGQNIHFEIINGYGPTETTIWSTAAKLKYKQETIVIGRPLTNETAYVLDNQQQPLPVGVLGELHIGGDGVARGYLNQPELTKEKFIANPFQSEEDKFYGRNGRLYKTGDLVRWLPDGNLEYVGRNDFQVKIRGYRIELGEIENKLADYPGIKQSIVIAKEFLNADKEASAEQKYLVAYYVADDKLDESKLQEDLSLKLPEYMLPRVFVHLKKLPLTPNGKIDRKALPEPKFIEYADYVAPRNEQEELICKAFSKVLKIEKIGINEDFFKLGGNSIKAISLTSTLRANFDINITDIFNLRTPKQLAQNTFFGKNMLRRKLEQVKLSYQKGGEDEKRLKKELESDKLTRYVKESQNLTIDPYQKKAMSNVLLTGATGYLGSNLLNQLLTSTSYNIYLLVRAKNDEEAFERTNKKYQFYFDESLDEFLGSRLFVFAADITEKNLGLSTIDYKSLTQKIDSIIHSAALTKHYGEYDRFYAANVQATLNLLELCKLTKLKDFHYISTYSVFNKGYLPNCNQYVFTEDDMADNLEGHRNVYVKTKYEGEKVVTKYKEQGVNANIYRVGNLAFISANGKVQENIEDNGFFHQLKCLMSLGVIADEISMKEISPVDLTAEAIIKLFDKKQLSNGTYHVFNPSLYNLYDFFTYDKNLSMMIVPISKFIDIIIGHLDNMAYQKLLERFLLHQEWLGENPESPINVVKVLADRTLQILKQLNFVWPPISRNVFNVYVKQDMNREKKT